jgi:hypothetical protein
MKFETILSGLSKQQDINMDGFKVLMKNDYLKYIIGCLLKIGNCMNAGNKTRGQADGFEIDAITKGFSIKDSDGKSIMQNIIIKLLEKDETFREFKDEFSPCIAAMKCKVDEVNSEVNKCKGQLDSNINMFKLL